MGYFYREINLGVAFGTTLQYRIPPRMPSSLLTISSLAIHNSPRQMCHNTSLSLSPLSLSLSFLSLTLSLSLSLSFSLSCPINGPIYLLEWGGGGGESPRKGGKEMAVVENHLLMCIFVFHFWCPLWVPFIFFAIDEVSNARNKKIDSLANNYTPLVNSTILKW